MKEREVFVVIGPDLMAGGHPPDGRPPQRPMLVESSLTRVFAAGDVRCGSVKRVASAAREGSIRLIPTAYSPSYPGSAESLTKVPVGLRQAAQALQPERSGRCGAWR